MKIQTELLKFNSDNELFEYFLETIKIDGITQWDYFVNWQKVLKNIKKHKVELNILNVLIGEKNIERELSKLILKYPDIIKVIPVLLAIRDSKVSIVTDVRTFEYLHYNFKLKNPTKEDAHNLALFFIKSGLGQLVTDKNITDLYDYALGVEVGLDSNGRKNRGGHQMENAVEYYISEVCDEFELEYLKEANISAIKKQWNIELATENYSRRLDYVINVRGLLFFFEVNFYNSTGSKLKSTATEYTRINKYWNDQQIQFVWITDGAGWLKTRGVLREYFDNGEFLLNLEMLKNGMLKRIIERYID